MYTVAPLSRSKAIASDPTRSKFQMPTSRPLADLPLPQLTIVGDVVGDAGKKIVHGDNYSVSAETITGAAFGRNTIRDVTTESQITQSITVADVTEEARRLAREASKRDAEELLAAIALIEKAADKARTRQGLQRLAGVASFLGQHGDKLVQLCKAAIQTLGF